MKLLSLLTLTIILFSGGAKAADIYETKITMSLEVKSLINGSKVLLQDLPLEVDMYAAAGACVLRVMNQTFTCINLDYIAGQKPDIYIQIPKLLSLLEFLTAQGALPADQFQKMKNSLIKMMTLDPRSLNWGFDLEDSDSGLFIFSFKVGDVQKLPTEIL